MNRSVSGAKSHISYKSIEETAPKYSDAFIPVEASVLHNVFVKNIADEVLRLVIPILEVMAEER